MADINVTLPTLDVTESIEVATITPANVTASMTVKEAFKNKNNSFVLVVIATSGGTLTIKAGDKYPNSVLGDLRVAIGVGVNTIRIQDMGRFETNDGDLELVSSGVAGTIFATAKRAGIRPVA